MKKNLITLSILVTLLAPQVSSAASLTDAQIQSILSLLSSFGAGQETIESVQAALGGTPTSSSTGTSSTSTGAHTSAVFSNNLTVGSTGADVLNLQKLLNADAETRVAASGAGSPGNESTYFGQATKAAVVKYQKKHGISPASGYVGPLTRTSLNESASGTTTTPAVPAPASPTPTPVEPAPPVSQETTLSIAADPSTPGYALAAGNSKDVVLGVLRLSATGESVSLSSLPLKLESGAATDVSRITLWDGTTQVGTATFTGSSVTASLSPMVVVPQDSAKTLTIKGDIASTDFLQPGVSGDLVQVAVDAPSVQGTGITSGKTISVSSGAVSFPGVRIFTSYPTITQLSLPSTALINAYMPLLRFSVTADSHGAASLAQFALNIVRTGGAFLSNFDIYCFSDANFTVPCSGLSTDGGITVTNPGTIDAQTLFTLPIQISPFTNVTAPVVLVVPSSSTHYFEVAGSVLGADSGSSISITLLGDTAPQTLTDITTASTSHFVWSPNSIRPTDFNDRDWTSGYGVPGLPAGGISSMLSAL